MNAFPPYEDVTDELERRIRALLPAHPEILEIEDVFDLFCIHGFECKDLSPSLSLSQAARALGRVKRNPKAA